MSYREQFIAAWVTQQQRAFSQSTRGIMTPEDRQMLEGEAEKAIVEVERAAAEKALLEAADDVELGDWSHHGNHDDRRDAEAEASTWLEKRAAEYGKTKEVPSDRP